MQIFGYLISLRKLDLIFIWSQLLMGPLYYEPLMYLSVDMQASQTVYCKSSIYQLQIFL